jgi:hypothetical protein
MQLNEKESPIPVFAPEIVGQYLDDNILVISVLDSSYAQAREEMEAFGLREGKDFVDFGIDSDERMLNKNTHSFMKIEPKSWSWREQAKEFALRKDGEIREAIPDYARDRSHEEGYNFIASLGFMITTHCTLRCAQCDHSVQYCKKPHHLDPEAIVSDLNRLLGVAHVVLLAILGGEPFLHPKFAEILRRMNEMSNKNAIDAVRVITNGAVMPSREALYEFSKLNNAIVLISDYAELSPKTDELAALCEEMKVLYKVIPAYLPWVNYGDIQSSRNYSQKELEHLFAVCEQAQCHQLLEGQFYLCPRVSILNEEHTIPFDENARFDVRNTPDEELSDRLHLFLDETHFLNGCQFCDGHYQGARLCGRGAQQMTAKA